jgi:hypothetical protein
MVCIGGASGRCGAIPFERLDRKPGAISQRATHGVFERLVAIAGVAGETEFLYWYNLDPEVGDRTLGDQTLRIAISVLGIDYDWIEVRTRHDHNGDKIDKVFARFTPDDVKEATE